MKSLFGIIVVCAACSGYSQGVIPKDRVVPIRFDQDIQMKGAKVGDPVAARTDEVRDLPAGTRFEGEIQGIRPASKSRPGFVEIGLTTMVLPDGSRVSVRAIPISLDAKGVRKDPDGRFTVSAPKNDRSKAVLGGLFGGLIIGKAIKKPLEGALIGALAGIVIAESERDDAEKGRIISKDKRYGALFTEEVVFGAAPSNPALEPQRGQSGSNDPVPARDRDRDTRGAEGRSQPPTMTIEGKEIQFEGDNRPFWDGETCMVPLRASAKGLNLDVTESRNGRKYYIDGPEATVMVELDSLGYRLNGRPGDLLARVTGRQGEVYVPIEVIRMATGKEIRVNGTFSSP